MKLALIALSLLVSAPASALRPLRASDFSVNPPPRAGSAEEARDFRVSRGYTATRTARDCARGNEFNHGPGVFTFRNLFAEALSPAELREAGSLMQEIFFDANSLANAIKRKYQRPYPFEFDGITSCVGDGKGDGSYPSGHSLVSTTVACLLADLYPRKAAPLRELGKFHGDIRVVIGRHFPSDVEEGRRLGEEACRQILADPEFRAERQRLGL